MGQFYHGRGREMGKWDFAMKSKALGGQSYLIRKVEMTYQ
jgi:hypothetical protein